MITAGRTIASAEPSLQLPEPMPATHKSPGPRAIAEPATKADIHGRIYKAIVEHRLQPGTKLTEERIADKVRGAAWKERSAALRLDRPALALLKAFTPMERYLDGRTLAHDVKNVHVPVRALRPIEEAISTSGGIPWDALSDDLSLRDHPHLFVAGEMIEWDAPTGGFLLQGAFSTGHWAAQGILAKLGLAEKV